MKNLQAIAATALIAVIAGRAHAQDQVPPELALRVMLRVLAYDKNLPAEPKDAFVILVAHEPGQKSRADEALKATAPFIGAAIRGRPLKFVSAEFSDAATLTAVASKHTAAALLLCTGLSRAGQDAATRVARARKLYTLALDPAFVENAATLGVDIHEGYPRIVLNVAAAKQANAEFDLAVLKRARMVQ